MNMNVVRLVLKDIYDDWLNFVIHTLRGWNDGCSKYERLLWCNDVFRDTKLSKIKTLRLAIAYINYLEELLKSERPCEMREGYGFGVNDEDEIFDNNKVYLLDTNHR